MAEVAEAFREVFGMMEMATVGGAKWEVDACVVCVLRVQQGGRISKLGRKVYSGAQSVAKRSVASWTHRLQLLRLCLSVQPPGMSRARPLRLDKSLAPSSAKGAKRG
jgi:hypothetical protein